MKLSASLTRLNPACRSDVMPAVMDTYGGPHAEQKVSGTPNVLPGTAQQFSDARNARTQRCSAHSGAVPAPVMLSAHQDVARRCLDGAATSQPICQGSATPPALRRFPAEATP